MVVITQVVALVAVVLEALVDLVAEAMELMRLLVLQPSVELQIQAVALVEMF
jgi:hypothetical protein